MINLFGDVLTNIFAPVLSLPFSLAVFLITVLLMGITSLIYYFLIDKEEFKRVKEKLKELQKESRRLQKENPKKAEELMKEILQLTHKQMMMNMKPMFATLFIVIIFLPWIASISFIHLSLNDDMKARFSPKFFTTSKTSYNIEIRDKTFYIPLDGKILKIPEEGVFKLGSNYYRVNRIDSENRKVELGLVVKPPFPIPFFSYGFGWLMWYILCSSVLLYTFRRALGL